MAKKLGEMNRRRYRQCATLLLLATGCSANVEIRPDWPAVVEADVDHLTGNRTGLFRTYGPTSFLVAGRDTVPVTVGYRCQLEDIEPRTAVDGLFLQVATPDTSLTSSAAEAFEELRGALGLLDPARIAIDGVVGTWSYEPRPALGAWFLDGTTGFRPPGVFDTREKREALVARVALLYDIGRPPETSPSALFSAEWPIATDQVASRYFGRDTLAVELNGVVHFSLNGFEAASDSVRFWCPVKQSHDEWNAERTAFLGRLDDMRTAYQERQQAEASRQAAAIQERQQASRQEAARRAAATAAQVERRRASLEQRRHLARAAEVVMANSEVNALVNARLFARIALQYELLPITSRAELAAACRVLLARISDSGEGSAYFTQARRSVVRRVCREFT